MLLEKKMARREEIPLASLLEHSTAKGENELKIYLFKPGFCPAFLLFGDTEMRKRNTA